MDVTEPPLFPERHCFFGHVGKLVSSGTDTTPICSCGWSGHGISTDRTRRPDPGFYRGTRSDALRELASHIGYDRSAHLEELDKAIAALALEESKGGPGLMHAAHRVVELQNELDRPGL